MIVVICACWLSTVSVAQEKPLNGKIHFSYLGEFIIAQPGLRIGYSHEYWQREKERKFRKEKKKYQSISGLYQLGFYNKKKLYVSLPLSASLIYNRTNTKGFIMQCGLGVGYDRTILKGTTYLVNDQGEVREKKLAGSGYFTSMYSLGLGVDFTKFSNSLPINIMYKNSLWVKHAYNGTFLPQWFTEIELSYILKSRK